MSNASGGDGYAASEPSVDNMALWMEATDGMKKGKIFEMGSLSRMYMPNHAGTSSSNMTGRGRSIPVFPNITGGINGYSFECGKRVLPTGRKAGSIGAPPVRPFWPMNR